MITSSIVAIILAAGKSSRMNAPKALLTMKMTSAPHITFAEHLVTLFKEANYHQVLLMTGYHESMIRKTLPSDIQQQYVKNWHQGMRASLSTGIKMFPQHDIVFTHVDHPLIHADTIKRLSQCTHLSIPTYQGKTGHPVFIPQHLTPHILAQDQRPLHEVLLTLNPDYIEVDDPGILININTPQMYQHYFSR